MARQTTEKAIAPRLGHRLVGGKGEVGGLLIRFVSYDSHDDKIRGRCSKMPLRILGVERVKMCV